MRLARVRLKTFWITDAKRTRDDLSERATLVFFVRFIFNVMTIIVRKERFLYIFTKTREKKIPFYYVYNTYIIVVIFNVILISLVLLKKYVMYT